MQTQIEITARAQKPYDYATDAASGTSHTPVYTAEQRGGGWSLCAHGAAWYFDRTQQTAERDAMKANERHESERLLYAAVERARAADALRAAAVNSAGTSLLPRTADQLGASLFNNALIRVMRTGFQKVAQVLSDALLRQTPQTTQGSNRKLVVFSDSRQDAAKLSAGMRFAHYRDALRQSLTEAVRTAGRGTQAFRDQLTGQPLDLDHLQLAAAFAASHPAEAATLSTALSPAANHPAPGYANLSYAQAAQQILQRGEHGPFPLAQLTGDIAARLLAHGMNPGGFGQEALWTDSVQHRGPWRDLYEWTPPAQPAPRPALSPEQRTHLQRIERAALKEVTDIVFASGRRSLEALRIALATTDRVSYPAPRPLVQETADGIIQVFGSRRSRLSTHDADPLQALPRYIIAYIHAVAAQNTENPRALEAEVISYLQYAGALSLSHIGVLAVERLALVRPGEQYYLCPRCRRVHLHRAGGVCIDCLVALDPPQPLSTAPAGVDYYHYLATQAGNIFRLNCEALKVARAAIAKAKGTP